MAADLTGVCVGGPLDGIQVTVRSDPFLAADKAEGKAWVYERPGADGMFAVNTDHDDSLIYPQGSLTGERMLDAARLWQAGEDSVLDIIAVSAGD